MTKTIPDHVIGFDFLTGKISGANFVETIGLQLMKLGTWMTRPMVYVGFSYGCRIVKYIFRSSKDVRMTVSGDSQFQFAYGDVYWSCLFDRGHRGTPDVLGFLKFAKDVPYSFMDCGANFGWMSIMVSSADLGKKPCIAIEADGTNLIRLHKNAELNGNRFECRHNAIFSKSGETVEIFGAKHEALSILPSEGEPTGNKVVTLAPNELLDWHKKTKAEAIVLKLDVEGVEIEAMKGSDKLLEHDCLIAYEDHGNDPNHEITKYLKDGQGFRIFACDTNSAQEITEYSQLDRLKKNPRVGYDFFATKSPLWLEKLISYSG